jgi:hypothetical protein
MNICFDLFRSLDSYSTDIAEFFILRKLGGAFYLVFQVVFCYVIESPLVLLPVPTSGKSVISSAKIAHLLELLPHSRYFRRNVGLIDSSGHTRVSDLGLASVGSSIYAVLATASARNI